MSSFTNAATARNLLEGYKRLYVCVYYYDTNEIVGTYRTQTHKGFGHFACMVICCTTQCYADIYFILMAIELITEEH